MFAPVISQDWRGSWFQSVVAIQARIDLLLQSMLQCCLIAVVIVTVMVHVADKLVLFLLLLHCPPPHLHKTPPTVQHGVRRSSFSVRTQKFDIYWGKYCDKHRSRISPTWVQLKTNTFIFIPALWQTRSDLKNAERRCHEFGAACGLPNYMTRSRRMLLNGGKPLTAAGRRQIFTRCSH